MIKRQKKLWNVFGTREFEIKDVLPAGGLYFTLGFLGHPYADVSRSQSRHKHVLCKNGK